VRFHLSLFLVILFLCAALAPVKSVALESDTTLTDAHIINLHRGYRFSLAPNDPVEKLLISGKLSHPEKGQKIKMNDTTEAVWEPIKADEERLCQRRAARRKSISVQGGIRVLGTAI